MKPRHAARIRFLAITAFSVSALFVSGCDFIRNAASGSSLFRKSTAVHYTQKIEDVPIRDLSKALDKTELADADKNFILAKLNAGIYEYASVCLYTQNTDEEYLEIDQYLFDEWVDAETGEHGKSPHGSKSTYRRLDGKWIEREGSHYGG